MVGWLAMCLADEADEERMTLALAGWLWLAGAAGCGWLGGYIQHIYIYIT